jgi:hypothetical protein
LTPSSRRITIGVMEPYTRQTEVDAAYASGVASFRIVKSAFPEFKARAGWFVREVVTDPVELIVVHTSRERTIVPGA